MMGLWSLLACGFVPSGLFDSDPCAPYATDIVLYGTCVANRAAAATSPAEALQLCEDLPPLNHDACTAGWVQQHPDGAPFEELLPLCGASADCAMLLHDRRPQGDYNTQVAFCKAHAGPYERDCIGHSAQRFLKTHPDEATIQATVAGPHAGPVITLLPKYLQCLGKTKCPELGRWTSQCEAGMFHTWPDPCSILDGEDGRTPVPDHLRSTTPSPGARKGG